MLKKLLDEFAVTEAHTREEINAINEQIAELERRVLASQQRLETVSQDKVKVHTMMSRYTASGDWSAPAATPPPAASNGGRRKKKETLLDEPSAEPALDTRVNPPPSPRASATRLKAIPDPTLAQGEPVSTANSPFIGNQEPAPQVQETPPVAQPQTQPGASQPFNFNFSQPSSPTSEMPAPDVSGSSWTPVPPKVPPAPTSPAQALSAGSFFDDEEDFDSAPQTPPQAPQASDSSPSNPFLKAVMSKNAALSANDPAAMTQDVSAVPAAPAAPEPDPFEADMQAMQAAKQEDENTGPQISDLEQDEESDDTVKSINDALRGLFR
jgi:hypothetical protein